MTLDEAIKRASEVADTKLQDAELSEIQGCYNNAKKCYACAEEHRQLAKFLMELKELKEQVQQNEKAILKIQKDFKGYVDLLNMPRDDYNGIMEYIDELSSVTLMTESEDNEC